MDFSFMVADAQTDSVYNLGHDLLFARRVPAGSTILIARRPRYTTLRALQRGNDALYASMGWLNRATWYRFSLTVKASSLPQYDTTVLAYMVLRGRVRTNQQDCKCGAYKEFARLPLTKGLYGSSVPGENGFREIGWSLNLTRDSVTLKRDSLRAKITYDTSGAITAVDPLVLYQTFYNRDAIVDTLPGQVIGRGIQVLSTDSTTMFAAYPTKVEFRYARIQRYDTIQRHHTLVWENYADQPTGLYGFQPQWFGGVTPGRYDTCLARWRRGLFGDTNTVVLDTTDIEGSELDIAVYSTGAVPIAFLGSRVNKDMYDSLRAGRLDVAVATILDSLYAYTNAIKLMDRPANADEPGPHTYRTNGLMARIMQRQFFRAGRLDTNRRLFNNLPSDADGYRLWSGDLDSTDLKSIHMIARQDYGSGGAYQIPIRYLNPDNISVPGPAGTHDSTIALFRGFACARDTNVIYVTASGDTIRDTLLTQFRRRIAYNLLSDHDTYIDGQQAGYGKFLDQATEAASKQGAIIPTLGRMVNVAKFRYVRLSPPTPVWNWIRPAWLAPLSDTSLWRNEIGGRYPSRFLRINTPEELTVEAWLSLSCGVDGIGYADMGYDNANVGFVHMLDGSRNHEYTSLDDWNYWLRDNYRTRYPRMWFGMQSRSNAVEHVNRTLKKLDSVVHLTQLVFNREQISMHDTSDRLLRIPMLSTVRARMASRYDTLNGGIYMDSVASGSYGYDSPEKTYLEVTHWYPGLRNTQERSDESRYLLFVNRRTWPVDRAHYSAWAIDTIGIGGSRQGLGAIDVRRPVVVLKNSTSIMTDSFLVTKVLDTTWRQSVAVGDSLALDWIEPGWGEMYKVTPLPSFVSRQGVAYNNSVRSENPSTDQIQCDRLLVYERDSIVYMRTVNEQVGTWSHEIRISDEVDTTLEHRSWNVHPAVAVSRNGHTCMVVWEHRNAMNNSATVEGCFFEHLPNGTTIAEGTWPGDTVRWQLSTLHPLSQSWMQLTPAVVGLEEGFLTAWSVPQWGIEFKAIRDSPLTPWDTSRTGRIYATAAEFGAPIDSTCEYPTLAYVPNWRAVDSAQHTFLRLSEMGDPDPLDTFGGGGGSVPGDSNHIVHLAWQQGIPSGSFTRHIMYDRIGIDFRTPERDFQAHPTLVIYHPVEHVCQGMFHCAFLHPSIAVDSARIGVTFEAWTWSHRLVALRFRDSIAQGANLLPWRTAVYKWGGFEWYDHLRPNSYPLYYERPSLTQFPKSDSLSLAKKPQGDLTWHWTNSPLLSTQSAGKSMEVEIYRYGWLYRQTLGLGQDPTMTLVPQVATSPWGKSSVFHRGDASLAATRPRPRDGVSTWYYRGVLVNTPGAPSVLLSSATNRVGIYSGYRLRIKGTMYSDTACAPIWDRPDVEHWLVPINPTIQPRLRLGTDGKILAPTTVPGMGPAFFAAIPPVVDSITRVDRVARTGVFTAGTVPVTILRGIAASDSVIPWLNAAPYDSIWSMPANVMMAMELVRDSDNTVLWTGDTISARGVAGDVREEEVEVPVDSVTTPGTEVYIRLRAVATHGLKTDVEGGFQFLEELLDSAAAKTVRPFGNDWGRVLPGNDRSELKLEIIVVPNPLTHSIGEVRIRVHEEGVVHVRLYDVNGTRVRELAILNASQPGEYGAEIDLHDLPTGTYTLVAEQQGRRVSTQLVVVQ